ncbi:MAG: hypothetical protein EPN62_13120 [Candidimonas sp.]|nr:MAG: hypothetical protein EPN77_11295 [Candidimonas sp.]TAM21902.1 MAG: hypothetical protein EPN62_13120 [Candidimonas sp.]
MLADHTVEIVADRGIHEKVGPDEWKVVCRQMESAFKRSDFESGVVGGIRMVTQYLETYFPASGQYTNVLPDEPAVLR